MRDISRDLYAGYAIFAFLAAMWFIIHLKGL